MLKKRKVKEKVKKTKTKLVVEDKPPKVKRLPKKYSRTIWIAFMIGSASFLMAYCFHARF